MSAPPLTLPTPPPPFTVRAHIKYPAPMPRAAVTASPAEKNVPPPSCARLEEAAAAAVEEVREVPAVALLFAVVALKEGGEGVTPTC